jgi:rod shape determining protein RodA
MALAVPRTPMASMRRNPTSPWRHLDIALLGCIGCVASLGALMVYSATRGAEEPYDSSYVKKQVMFILLGGLVMLGVAAIDYHRLRDVAPAVYLAAAVALMLVVTPLGSRLNGTQGWFQLGPFQLQPSEFAKLALIVALAALASQFRGDIDLRRLGALLLVAAVPMGLVMLQPDLGTTLVSAAITMTMLVVAGIRGRHIALILIGSAVLTVGVFQSGVLKEYQLQRLSQFTSDEEHSQSELRAEAYNIEQSQIAIGSGGLTGKGYLEGPQTRLGSVPEQHTDFIFTAVAEELGFLGGGTLLTLFAVIVWRIWRTAQLAKDDFGTLLCVGVLALFVFQIFQNVGMTMKIMPITGLPLPFMSYGGSSTITAFIAMGLVLNVHMRRFS